MNIDTSANGFLFTAPQAAAQEAAADAMRRKEKQSGVKKSFFSSLIKETNKQNVFAAQGLPPEIAEMSDDDAFVFLKDEMDTAGDNLSMFSSGENFDRYKKAVSQFIKFIQKTNYRLEERKASPAKRRKTKIDYDVVIKVVNEKLDRLAYEIWYNHLDKFKLLEKINEINGLVIDLTAN